MDKCSNCGKFNSKFICCSSARYCTVECYEHSDPHLNCTNICKILNILLVYKRIMKFVHAKNEFQILINELKTKKFNITIAEFDLNSSKVHAIILHENLHAKFVEICTTVLTCTWVSVSEHSSMLTKQQQINVERICVLALPLFKAEFNLMISNRDTKQNAKHVYEQALPVLKHIFEKLKVNYVAPVRSVVEKLVLDQCQPVQIRICVVCSNESNKKCSKCFVPYCSVKCQKIDWNTHKLSCFSV